MDDFSKIYRRLSREESVELLKLELKKKNVEIGKLTSEIAYLEQELEDVKEFRDRRDNYKKNYREAVKGNLDKEIIQSYKDQIKDLEASNRKLKIENERLFLKTINNG